MASMRGCSSPSTPFNVSKSAMSAAPLMRVDKSGGSGSGTKVERGVPGFPGSGVLQVKFLGVSAMCTFDQYTSCEKGKGELITCIRRLRDTSFNEFPFFGGF